MINIFFSFLLFLTLTMAHPRIQASSAHALADKFEEINVQVQPKSEGAATVEDLPTDEDALFIFRDSADFKNMDMDGVQAVHSTNTQQMRDLPLPAFDDEKSVPQMPFDGEKREKQNEDFLKPQPGVVPRFTGSFKESFEEEPIADVSIEDYSDSAVSNPSSFFLDGANFDKIASPKCHMIGCTGPLPNDGTISISTKDKRGVEMCHQTFVPLNGCTDNKGYPMGMLCQICCECSKPFVKEFMKTRGFKTSYPSE